MSRPEPRIVAAMRSRSSRVIWATPPNSAEIGPTFTLILPVTAAVLLAAVERSAGQAGRDVFHPAEEGPYLFDG